jgi:DNA (cytosine-5)-methyltransferase 1
MFTLTSQDRHGVMIVKDGTKKGYTEFTPTEETTIDLRVPDSATRRGRVKEGVTGTLDTQCNVGVFSNFRIRKLTPLECWRLQGFPDEHFHKAKASGVSDSQLYKQAGNSVTVNVIKAIARELE